MASSLFLLPAAAKAPWPVPCLAGRAGQTVQPLARDHRVLPAPAVAAAPVTLARSQHALTDALPPDLPGVDVDNIPFCNDAAVLTDDLARPAPTETTPEADLERQPVDPGAEDVALPPERPPERQTAPPEAPAGPWRESLRILRQPASDPPR